MAMYTRSPGSVRLGVQDNHPILLRCPGGPSSCILIAQGNIKSLCAVVYKLDHPDSSEVSTACPSQQPGHCMLNHLNLPHKNTLASWTAEFRDGKPEELAVDVWSERSDHGCAQCGETTSEMERSPCRRTFQAVRLLSRSVVRNVEDDSRDQDILGAML